MKFYNEYIRLYRYFHYLGDKKSEDLLLYLEQYINMATTQMERIQEDEEQMSLACESKEIYNIEKRISFGKHSCDIHFLILCIDKVFKLSHTLSEQMNDSRLKLIVDDNKEKEYYRKFRNSLEHMEQRITSDSHKFRKDFSFMANDFTQMGDIYLYIGPSSLDPLYIMYEEIIKRLDEIFEPIKEKVDKIFNS
jgi:hypothetical protein